MSANIPQVSTANTFDFWRIQTNNVIDDVNELANFDYTKASGTLTVLSTIYGGNVYSNNRLVLTSANVTDSYLSTSTQNPVSANIANGLYNLISTGGGGAQGAQGATGSGTTGSQGVQGVQGPSGGGGGGGGSQGTQGIQGLQGRTGIQGINGVQGLTGSQGFTGTPGVGSQGTQGTTGSGGLIQSVLGGYTYNVCVTAGAGVTFVPYVDGSGGRPSDIFTYNTTSQTLSVLNIYAVTSLGVGTAPSGASGTIIATGNITAYYSDSRLKENIVPIENALEKVMAISGVKFNSNDLAAKYGYADKHTQVGVIAQEIQAVLPEVVVGAPFDTAYGVHGPYSISGENYKTVQYDRLVPLLIQAIKELKAEVDALKGN